MRGQAIESEETGNGIADAFVALTIGIAFIECKRIRASIQGVRKIPFQPGQYPWLSKFDGPGRRSYVAIEYDDGMAVVPIGVVDAETKRYDVGNRRVWVWEDSRMDQELCTNLKAYLNASELMRALH